MKKFFIILFVFMIMFSMLSGCNNIQNNLNSYQEPTNTPGGVTPVVQPHGEKTYEEMISFINTVDENTFEEGQFKSIIDRVREENYIIRPLYDGEPATFANRDNNDDFFLEPYYVHADYPPQFMYHFEDDGYKYRINIIYIDEAYIDVADADGYLGYKYYRDGDTSGNWRNTEDYDKISHKTVHIDGKDRNVTFETWTELETTEAFFVWDKYLIKIVGDHIENEHIYDVCNIDILPHLSFEKVPLK